MARQVVIGLSGLLSAGAASAASVVEVPIWKSCKAVDVGGQLLLAPAHCADLLPRTARVLVRGIPKGPFDYTIALLPELAPRGPVPCRERLAGWWGWQRVRLEGPGLSGLVRLPGTRAGPGVSGSPVTTWSGELVTIVVGYDARTREALALAPRVVCAALQVARSKLPGGRRGSE